MIRVVEDKIKIPKPPRKAHSNKYNSTLVHLSDSYSDELEFEILKNKASAFGFINNTLYNYDFPMAAREWTLREYYSDPEYYYELMSKWEDNNPISDDDQLFFKVTWDDCILIDSGSTLKDAYRAFKYAHEVDALIFSDGYTDVVFKGFIYRDYDHKGDEEFMWRSSIDSPDNFIDMNKYEWKNIHGTLIQGDEIKNDIHD